ncbi:unnamed protein product [Diplocarpon coronariae]|nr:hypothetical protein JHW43_000048 [Diplocarpon mali]
MICCAKHQSPDRERYEDRRVRGVRKTARTSEGDFDLGRFWRIGSVSTRRRSTDDVEAQKTGRGSRVSTARRVDITADTAEIEPDSACIAGITFVNSRAELQSLYQAVLLASIISELCQALHCPRFAVEGNYLSDAQRLKGDLVFSSSPLSFSPQQGSGPGLGHDTSESLPQSPPDGFSSRVMQILWIKDLQARRMAVPFPEMSPLLRSTPPFSDLEGRHATEMSRSSGFGFISDHDAE